jgi:hypothetical protein
LNPSLKNGQTNHTGRSSHELGNAREFTPAQG